MNMDFVSFSLLAGPWRWDSFGGPLMLVAGGAKVVLMVGPGGPDKGKIVVRDESGRLVAIKSNHPIAKLLAAVPDMVEILQDIEQRNDRPRQIEVVRDVLRGIGL